MGIDRERREQIVKKLREQTPEPKIPQKPTRKELILARLKEPEPQKPPRDPEAEFAQVVERGRIVVKARERLAKAGLPTSTKI